jgi:fructose-1-phosphate kinase PfkB-like protein
VLAPDERVDVLSRGEVAGVARPLVEDREGLAEREVLAEGQQVVLVVAAEDGALGVRQEGAVEVDVALVAGA